MGVIFKPIKEHQIGRDEALNINTRRNRIFLHIPFYSALLRIVKYCVYRVFTVLKMIGCCIPGCIATGVSLHRFPNPKKCPELFNVWLEVIGLSSLRDMTMEQVYQNRRICFAHFDPKYKSPGNPRIHHNAVPSIGLPGGTLQIEDNSTVSNASENIVDAAEDRPLTPIAEFPLPGPSGLSNIVMPTHQDPVSCRDEEDRPLTPISAFPSPGPSGLSNIVMPTHQDLVSCREGELLRSVKSRKKIELTPKARKLYDSAIVFKRRAERNRKKCLSFKQRLALAEKYSETKSFQDVSHSLTPAGTKFLWLQTREGMKKPRGRRFTTTDEKTLSLSLFKRSPKGYDLLKEMFTLPCRKTLNNFLGQLRLNPGINEALFSILEKQVEKMPKHHRLCSIIFDEMSISPHVNYDVTNDCVQGFTDNGQYKTNSFADHALVFMARGVIKKWKQPLVFTFCEGSTKNEILKSILKDVIARLQNIGLKVICTVCDQGKPNQKAVNSLIEDTAIEYNKKGEEMRGEFFEVNGQKIVPLFDPPHLLKCIRNNLLKYDLKFEEDGKQMTAKWKHVIDLYEEDIIEESSDLRELPKLTEAHVRPKANEKMKVSFCSQVFSQRLAASLRLRSKYCPDKADYIETARLFIFFDKLFDSVNSSTVEAVTGKELKGALKEKSPHEEFWRVAVKKISSMVYIERTTGKCSKPDCLKNWIKTIRGFEMIWKILQADGIKFLLLRNFNQDPLENFFGSIRSQGVRNVNPSCQSFIAAYKTLLINNFMAPHSIGANCELDISEGALTTLKELFNSGSSIIQSSTELNINNIIELDEDFNASLKTNFCCGYILKKLKRILTNCATCKNNLNAAHFGLQHELIREREYLDQQTLLQYPSFSAATCFTHIKKITYYVLEKSPTSSCIVRSIEEYCQKNVNFDFLECEIHKEKNQKKIIHDTIMLIMYGYLTEINRILCGKKIVRSIVGHSLKKNAIKKREKMMKNKQLAK